MNSIEHPGAGGEEFSAGGRGGFSPEKQSAASGVQFGGETAEPFSPPQPPTVLVIDDEPPIRLIAVRILRSAGYTVMDAAGGAEALEIVGGAERPFDAVLLDLTMPKMDGAQALRALLDVDPGLRVLLMSGYGEQETLSRFADQKVAGFVSKPFTAGSLLKKVREVLEAGKRG